VRLLSPRQDYLLAWTKDFFPGQKQSREYSRSRVILAWTRLLSLEREYLLAWVKDFSSGQK